MLRIYNLTLSINLRRSYKQLGHSHSFDNSINGNKNFQFLTSIRNTNSGNDDYISDVIKNFNKFSENEKRKKSRKQETDSAINESDETTIADVVIKHFKRNYSSNYKKHIHKQGINIDVSVQNSIDTLLKEGKYIEARDMIINNAKNNCIPNFATLRRISSWLGRQGDSHNLRIIQDIAKSYHKLSLEKENGFDHYLCEAIFREGDHKESFILLTSLLENATLLKKAKETACFLMRMVPNISEKNQNEAFEIARKFIITKGVYKPAVVLWITSFQSNQYNLHHHAEKLWQEYPNLLDEEEECLTNVLKEATHDNNYELLLRLLEVILKLADKKMLQQVVSSLLYVYCIMENIPKARETFKFAQEENIYIPADILHKYMNLQHKKKHLASQLAQSLGFDKVI